MKRNHKRIWRSVVSVLLVLSLVLGSVSTVFATEGPEEINYVSIGDSMANGYGFVDYAQGNHDINHDAYNFIEGENMYGEGAYPLQFEAYLTSKGYKVKHTKLAPSALLAEDLLYLLDGREEFDDGWAGYKDYVGGLSDAELKPHFQKAITEADLITMGIGNASFGAFMLDRVTSALGVFGASLDEDEKLNFEDAIEVLDMDAEQHAEVMKIYEDLEANLDTSAMEAYVEADKLEQVVDIIAYTAAAYIVNYKLLMEKIMEMNPDAEIVLVELLNTTYGMNITDEDGNVLVRFGDLMDSAFDILNAYMAAVPTAKQADGEWLDAKFYYAKQPAPLFICQEFANLKAAGWSDIQDGRLSGKTVRQRNIDAYNDSLAPMIGNAFNLGALPSTNLTQVTLFDEAEKQSAGSGFFAVYAQYGQMAAVSTAVYLGIEDAVAESTDTMDIQLTGLMKIADIEALQSVFAGLDGEKMWAEPQNMRSILGEYLTSTNELKGMCKVYGLFKVGNGMSVHPTPEGHDNIAAAVIEAYEAGYTANAEVEKLLLDYLNENYPNLMEAVSSSQGIGGNIDDLEIIVSFLKSSDNAALEGVDLDALEAQIRELNKYVDTELAPEDKAFVMELANDLMDRTQNLASKATYTKYEPTEESIYVALGDANANSDAPAELAKKLYGDDWKEHFAKMDQAGMRCEDMLNMLEDETFAEEVSKADLISVSLGNGDVTSFVTEQLVRAAAGEKLIEMDWEKVGVKSNATLKELNELLDVAVPIVDALGLADKYMPEGMDVKDPAKFARTLVESLLYGYASYNQYYTQVLDKIHEINPEAQVMVLGMFNPADDWTLETEYDGENVVVPIGGVINNLIESANIQSLAYALQTENTIFVDLSDNMTTLDEAIADGAEPSFAEYFKAILGVEGEKAEITAAGQEYMTEQMYAALQENYLDNEVKVAVEYLLPLIEKYYDDAYKYAYRYANDQGYIDEAVKGIDAAIAELEAIRADLEAIESDMTDEFRAEALKQIDEIIETLEKAKELVMEADVLDQATLDALLALLNEAGEDMVQLYDTLEQAAIDVNQLAIIPALKEAHKILINEVLPQVDKQLQIAVAKGTEWLMEKLDEAYAAFIEALPEIDAFLYDWLYENPELVLGFFYEYGDEMGKFIEENYQIIGAIIGYIGYTYGDDVLQAILDDPEGALKDFVAWYDKYGERTWKMIDRYMEASGLKDLIKEKAPEIIQGAIEEAVDLVEKYGEEVLKEVYAYLEDNGYIDILNAAIEDFEEALDAIEANYVASTSLTYELNKDNYYVALGDSTAYAFDEDRDRKNDVTPYGDRLAKELGLANGKYKNLSEESMTAEKLLATIEANKEDIAKADLVTIGLGNGEIIQFVLDQMLADEPVEIDWSKLAGEKAAAEVEKALAKIEEKLLESMDQATADMMMLALESYAYRYAEIAAAYPAAIEAIHALSPDAQVVIVGMYNPLEDVVFAIEGMEKIAIGEYLDYIVQLSNAYCLGVALLNEDVVYVDAPAVENSIKAGDMGLRQMMNLLLNPESLYPTDAGHEYIKEQIMDITTLTEGLLWGDANRDGKVSPIDASFVLQYYTKQMTEEDLDVRASDVNGDGKVTPIDASFILQHYTKQIDKFPVEQ